MSDILSTSLRAELPRFSRTIAGAGAVTPSSDIKKVVDSALFALLLRLLALPNVKIDFMPVGAGRASALSEDMRKMRGTITFRLATIKLTDACGIVRSPHKAWQSAPRTNLRYGCDIFCRAGIPKHKVCVIEADGCHDYGSGENGSDSDFLRSLQLDFPDERDRCRNEDHIRDYIT